MFFSLALLVSALIVPTVLGVPSALSGNFPSFQAAAIDARGGTTAVQDLALVGDTLNALQLLHGAMNAIPAPLPTCFALSQAQAQVKALTSCMLSSNGALRSCAGGQNVLSLLSSNNVLGGPLCTQDPSVLLTTLPELLGLFGGLGGLLNPSCLVEGTVALLDSVLGLTGCGCDPALVGALLAALQGVVLLLNKLLACGASCADCHNPQFLGQVSALITLSGLI
ncbi:hypothetical protein B0H13DRAFT_2316767 [Mycena leptocephala]|nr:hypothetical protein B0H13DRAFT_2316767 [Mycena leptocephala]